MTGIQRLRSLKTGRMSFIRGARLMLSVPMASAIFGGAILLGASAAWAQSPPRKTRSPAEVEQAINDYNSKIANCRRQAREQKLHFMKRRRFICDCVNNTP
jgi:hypothetical protein